MFNIKRLKQIYESCLEKPFLYEFICYGGSTLKIVNERSAQPTMQCSHAREKHWMTPACADCNGVLKGSYNLTDRKEAMNYGVKQLYDAIYVELLKKENQMGD